MAVKISVKRALAFVFMLCVLAVSVSCAGGESQLQVSVTESPVHSDAPSPSPTATAAVEATPYPAAPFEVHFLDVGEGDAAVVLCGGHAALIDGGSGSRSSLIYSYLKSHSITHLDYIFATHSDEDHIGGIAGALNYASADRVFCSVSSGSTKAFRDFTKYVEKNGLSITVPATGEELPLGDALISIIGPVREGDTDNNNSLVLRIVFKNTSFLFAGDMEREEEQDLIDSGYPLESTLLKVGHHGSRNATSYPFLREVMPEYAVISVGANQYGHPSEDTLSKLRDEGAKVFRTDLQGHIVCTSDGESISVSVAKNEDADTLAPTAAQAPEQTPGERSDSSGEASEDDVRYVLNKNTHVFHYPSCSSVDQMSDKNKIFFNGTREEAIEMGYRPCGRCHP